MKRTILLIVVVAAFAWPGTTAQADPFVNPPEVNHPKWITDFPYQRNIMVGFDTNPHLWPDHESSPQPDDRKALTPDLIHHEGTEDGTLFRSDWVGGEATGNGYTDWIDTAPEHSGRQGMLKLAVDAGMGEAAIHLVWHIDNLDRPWEEKHFFAEAEYFTTGNSGVDKLFSSMSSGTPVTLVPHMEMLTDGWIRWWAEGTLVPNPEWEEMVNVVEFAASSTDSYLLIDYMHIATECVPEPATLGLLTL
ncbi:MAG: hypothetical protein JW829_11815, partial [Pirellulales bacterium]|nr:hypothetical protein [Pirellulales bacterium]